MPSEAYGCIAIDGRTDEEKLVEVLGAGECAKVDYEEKAFYDIRVKVRDEHGFPYAEDKCIELAKSIRELVEDKSQYAGWATREDIKGQLEYDLTVLLYRHGHPPEWNDEVFEKAMQQEMNYKAG